MLKTHHRISMNEHHLIKLCTVEIVSFCCIHAINCTVHATTNFAKLEYLSPYLHNSSSSMCCLFLQGIMILAHSSICSLGSYYHRTVVRMCMPQTVQIIGQVQCIDTALLIKRVWLFSGILQLKEILTHITCCLLGSNNPKTIELCSPKLNAYKS